MSPQISSSTVELVQKLDEIRAVDLRKILPKEYEKRDIDEAADLISKMIRWVPSERYTCK